jgi:hypothetical protein
MNKYLSIATDAGTELVPIGNGLFVEQTTAAELRLYSPDSFSHHFSLSTAGGTFALVNAINAALTEAAQTNWRDIIHPVALPAGETVTSIAVAVFA